MVNPTNPTAGPKDTTAARMENIGRDFEQTESKRGKGVKTQTAFLEKSSEISSATVGQTPAKGKGLLGFLGKKTGAGVGKSEISMTPKRAIEILKKDHHELSGRDKATTPSKQKARAPSMPTQQSKQDRNFMADPLKLFQNAAPKATHVDSGKKEAPALSKTAGENSPQATEQDDSPAVIRRDYKPVTQRLPDGKGGFTVVPIDIKVTSPHEPQALTTGNRPKLGRSAPSMMYVNAKTPPVQAEHLAYVKDLLSLNGLGPQALSSPEIRANVVNQILLTDQNWLSQMSNFFPDARSVQGNVSERVKNYTESVVKQFI